MSRYNAPGEILPYTDTKLMQPEIFRLDNEQMVEIGQRGCRGETVDEIAVAMNLPHDAIRRYLHPEESTQTRRQEVASVGFANFKRGR